MSFDEMITVLEKAFRLELKIVDDTTAFEVAEEDGDTRVRVVLQNEDERKVVLMSADLGPPPPDGGEKLYLALLEANNLFAQTAGATLAFDGAARRFRLQKYEPQGDLAEDAEKKLVSFIETALFWSRAIADFRPADGAGEAELDNFHMISV